MVRHLERGNFSSAAKCLLIDLYFPTETKGYYCLVSAISLYHADPWQSLTKEIYPAVGQLAGLGKNEKRVEKLIREAVQKAWKRRDRRIWDQYFPGEEKPTNREFISKLSEVLDLWEACCAGKK